MLTWSAIALAGVGAINDARAMRPLGTDAAALDERHRLRIVALKFYRSAFAILIGVTLGRWLLG